jgi:hypothetical protein
VHKDSIAVAHAARDRADAQWVGGLLGGLDATTSGSEWPTDRAGRKNVLLDSRSDINLAGSSAQNDIDAVKDLRARLWPQTPNPFREE